MDKLRTKLEELLKSMKAAKKIKNESVKLPPVPEPEDHPANIPERDVKGIISGKKPITKGEYCSMSKNGQWSIK